MQTLDHDKLKAALLIEADAKPPAEAPRDYTIAEVIVPLLDPIREMRSRFTLGPDGVKRPKIPFTWPEILELLNKALSTIEAKGKLKCNPDSLQKTYYRLLKARPASPVGSPAPQPVSLEGKAPAAHSGAPVGDGAVDSLVTAIPATPAPAGEEVGPEEVIQTFGEDHDAESGADNF